MRTLTYRFRGCPDFSDLLTFKCLLWSFINPTACGRKWIKQPRHYHDGLLDNKSKTPFKIHLIKCFSACNFSFAALGTVSYDILNNFNVKSNIYSWQVEKYKRIRCVYACLIVHSFLNMKMKLVFNVHICMILKKG